LVPLFVRSPPELLKKNTRTVSKPFVIIKKLKNKKKVKIPYESLGFPFFRSPPEPIKKNTRMVSKLFQNNNKK
jgi:hypothetical protein